MPRFSRTNLISVAGIASTYSSPQDPTNKLDVSKLTGICFLTPDTNQALHNLNNQVKVQGGSLFVSDLFRSWAIQKKANDDWIAGKRSDYAAPPGESFHMAGRAIDIDTQHLSFACPKNQWLSKFWTIAQAVGWRPIISNPDASLNESWHFQYLGKDWSHLIGQVDDGQIAKCAILDSGQWDATDPLFPILFLQSQCNRLCSVPKTPSALILDGHLGPKSQSFVTGLLGPSWTVQSACEKLIAL